MPAALQCMNSKLPRQCLLCFLCLPQTAPRNSRPPSCLLAGIYVARPPQQKQILLANAQQQWLLAAAGGAAAGWRQLATPSEAQAAANSGLLTLVSYANPDPNEPGG